MPLLRSFGRTRGRPLRKSRAALLETVLPVLATPAGPFDPRRIAPDPREVWLEIGFGAGEHLAGQAARAPDVLVLGAEPFVNGVASAARLVGDKDLTNVRLHGGDGRDLMAALPAASIDRMFLLFPDPWPKTRHHKRRLVTPAFVAEAARILRPGGEFRFATDWADYADWTLARFLAAPTFSWMAQEAADWRRPPPDHLPTRYELKRLGDCAPVWLRFLRTSAPADSSSGRVSPSQPGSVKSAR